ncbi:hypothetical protein BDV29DRAFT_57027 [Aspergillus leporis]|uniref:Uncharacterized protein n=1 Tax=Aspergillus leporis TaxID=41062 RepID=A0A5N5WL11_9EURO|nr:hypothetical protein BDV29DRAFT_57027 [Aspergillus leporis]
MLHEALTLILLFILFSDPVNGLVLNGGCKQSYPNPLLSPLILVLLHIFHYFP